MAKMYYLFGSESPEGPWVLLDNSDVPYSFTATLDLGYKTVTESNYQYYKVEQIWEYPF